MLFFEAYLLPYLIKASLSQTSNGILPGKSTSLKESYVDMSILTLSISKLKSGHANKNSNKCLAQQTKY